MKIDVIIGLKGLDSHWALGRNDCMFGVAVLTLEPGP